MIKYSSLPILSIVLGLLVDSIENGNTEEYILYIYFIAIFILLIVPNIAAIQSFFHGTNAGLTMKSCCLKFIFSKSLRVSSRSIRGVSAGKLISMAAEDCEMLEMTSLLWSVFLSPAIMVIWVVLLYITIGPVSLVPTFYTLFVMLGLQLLAKIQTRNFTNKNNFSD